MSLAIPLRTFSNKADDSPEREAKGEHDDTKYEADHTRALVLSEFGHADQESDDGQNFDES